MSFKWEMSDRRGDDSRLSVEGSSGDVRVLIVRPRYPWDDRPTARNEIYSSLYMSPSRAVSLGDALSGWGRNELEKARARRMRAKQKAK